MLYGQDYLIVAFMGELMPASKIMNLIQIGRQGYLIGVYYALVVFRREQEVNGDAIPLSQWKIEDLVKLTWLKIVGLLATTPDPNLIPALQGVKLEIEKWRAKAPDAMPDDEMRRLCIEALG